VSGALFIWLSEAKLIYEFTSSNEMSLVYYRKRQ